MNGNFVSKLLFLFEVNVINWYNLLLSSRALQFDFPSVYQLFNDFRLFNDSHFWAYQNNYHIWYKITLINWKIDRKWGFKSCHHPLKIKLYFDTMQRYHTERCNLPRLSIKPKRRVSVFNHFDFTFKQSVYITQIKPTVIPRYHSIIIINWFNSFTGFINLFYQLLQLHF